jgi:tRNA (mo5U34)-methyltransferase
MIQNIDYVKKIPTELSQNETKEKLLKYDNWFYEFKFSNGAKTDVSCDITRRIHQTRAEMIFPFLDQMFQRNWDEARCLDIASHQGWFAFQLALRKAHEVLGLDIRDEHIEMASLIKELSNLNSINFKKENLYNVTIEKYGKFEITFFLGILYHLDNPLEALRKIYNVTKNICVIETQVARGSQEIHCLWGSSSSEKKGPALSLIEADEAHVENDHPVVLIPTLNALYKMLFAVGFARIYLCIPQTISFQQYKDMDRVIAFAQVL